MTAELLYNIFIVWQCMQNNMNLTEEKNKNNGYFMDMTSFNIYISEYYFLCNEQF